MRPIPPPPGGSSAPPRRRRLAGHLLRLLLLLMAVGLLLLIGFMAMSWWMLGPPVSVPDGCWIELRLAGPLPEERPFGRGLVSAMREDEPSAQELGTALRHAAGDHRVRGVFLRPDGYEGGWAQARAIREALLELRGAGKAVVAYVEAPGAAAYYMATAADSVVLAPEGRLMLVGLQARLSYLKGTLDKLGVQADFVAVGEYKSAPEQLMRTDPSEPGRRQILEYLDDLYADWIAEMAAGRGVTPEQMMRLVDLGGLEAEEALAEGLADRLEDDMALWRSLGGGEIPPLLDAIQYLRATPHPRGHSAGVLALVYATGSLASGYGQEDGMMGPVVGSETLVERLRRAGEDDDVAAVVLRIDSPGGSAVASDVVYRELLHLRELKPVVVSMGDVAASGGYYIGMGADRIVADPLTLTGSIGVYAGKLQMSGLYEKLGLSFEELRRGENADLFSELQPFRPEQRTRLREQLEQFYDRFVDRVAEGRGLDPLEAERAARGRVWSGRRALAMGLVDSLGTLEDALGMAKELGGLPPDRPVELRTYQREPGLWHRVLAQALQDARVRAPIPPWGSAGLLRELPVGLLLTLDGSPWFHLPWELRIR